MNAMTSLNFISVTGHNTFELSVPGQSPITIPGTVTSHSHIFMESLVGWKPDFAQALLASFARDCVGGLTSLQRINNLGISLDQVEYGTYAATMNLRLRRINIDRFSCGYLDDIASVIKGVYDEASTNHSIRMMGDPIPANSLVAKAPSIVTPVSPDTDEMIFTKNGVAILNLVNDSKKLMPKQDVFSGMLLDLIESAAKVVFLDNHMDTGSAMYEKDLKVAEHLGMAEKLKALQEFTMKDLFAGLDISSRRYTSKVLAIVNGLRLKGDTTIPVVGPDTIISFLNENASAAEEVLAYFQTMVIDGADISLPALEVLMTEDEEVAPVENAAEMLDLVKRVVATSKEDCLGELAAIRSMKNQHVPQSAAGGAAFATPQNVVAGKTQVRVQPQRGGKAK